MADYYTASSDPATNADVDSSVIRAEHAAIAAGFAKIAAYTGAANRVVHMNAGATAPEWAKGLKVGTFTYNMNEASGNKAITGVGFKGGALICFASIQDTPYAWSAGFSDGATHGSIVKQVQATVVMQVSGVLINIGKTSGESQTAVLSSFDADGFTLAFTKTGAYAGADAMTVKWFVLR